MADKVNFLLIVIHLFGKNLQNRPKDDIPTVVDVIVFAHLVPPKHNQTYSDWKMQRNYNYLVTGTEERLYY